MTPQRRFVSERKHANGKIGCSLPDRKILEAQILHIAPLALTMSVCLDQSCLSSMLHPARPAAKKPAGAFIAAATQFAKCCNHSAKRSVFAHRFIDQCVQLLPRYRYTFGSFFRVIACYWTVGSDGGCSLRAVTRASRN